MVRVKIAAEGGGTKVEAVGPKKFWKFLFPQRRREERDCGRCLNPCCPASVALHTEFPLLVSPEDLYNPSINLIDRVFLPPAQCPDPGWMPPAETPPTVRHRYSRRFRKELSLVRQEMEALFSDIEEFRSRLAQLDSLRADLSRSFSDIHSGIENLTPQLEQKKLRPPAEPDVLENLTKEVERLERWLADFKTFDDIQTRIEKLEDTTVSRHDLAVLRTELHSLRTQLPPRKVFAELAAKVELLTRVAAEEENLRRLPQALEELRRQIVSRENFFALAAELELLRGTVMALREQTRQMGASAAESRAAEVQRQLEVLAAAAARRTELDRLTAKLENFRGCMAEREKLEALAARVEMLESSSAARLDLELLHSQMDQLRLAAVRRDRVDELAGRLAELETAFAAARQDTAEQFHSLKTETASLRAVNELSSRLRELKDTAASQEELTSLSRAVHQLAKTAAKEDHFLALARRMEKLERDTASRSALTELAQKFDQLSASLPRQISAALVSLRPELDTAVRKLVGEEAEKLTSQLAALEKKMEAVAGQSETGSRELRRELEEIAAQAEEFTRRLASAEKSISWVSADKREWEENFTARLTSVEAELRELKEKLTSLSSPAGAAADHTLLERLKKLEVNQSELRRQIRRAFENLESYPLRDLSRLRERVEQLEQRPAPPLSRPAVPVAAARPAGSHLRRNLAIAVVLLLGAGLAGLALAWRYTGSVPQPSLATVPGESVSRAEGGSFSAAGETTPLGPVNAVYEREEEFLAPPVLELFSERLHLREGKIQVAGYAPGAVAAVLYVNNEEQEQTEVKDDSFDFGEVELRYGVNVLEVKAVDRAGNEATSLALMVERMSSSAALLRTTRGLNRMRGPRHLPHLALTIDAGSSNRRADRILDVLAQKGIITTFFLTGQFIERYPETVLRIVHDGHEVGNHTYSHPHLTTFSYTRRHTTAPGVTREFLQQELLRTQEAFESLTAQTMAPWWRAPYGEYNHQILEWAEEAGFRHVDWTRTPENLDLLDWVSNERDPHYLDAEALFRRLILIDRGRFGQANGAIILMHLGTDRKKDFLDEVLPRALDELLARGYHFVTISRMFTAEGSNN